MPHESSVHMKVYYEGSQLRDDLDRLDV